MKYDPKDANKCFPAGNYKAALRSVVTSDENGPLISKTSGEKMEYWEIEVYGPNDKKMTMRNYVTASSAAWQYRRLASVFGQDDVFKAGNFDPANFIDSIFEVELEIKDYRGEDQNQIKKFIKPQEAVRTEHNRAPVPANPTITEEDIPF